MMNYPVTDEEIAFNNAALGKVSMKPVSELSMCVPQGKSEPHVFVDGKLVGSATKIRWLLDYWEGNITPSPNEVEAMFSLQ
ncbi:hypothetical protein BPNPMPFG_000309 [Mesorhizobium sp. AR07]|uniref:hypothetical protein n=1 Tax=Mesorhizobium sp. AR07 TaxID=2865838 RepID=UPI002160403D|nr:hypothetical protein [Mesorhizobium sp. AR07]UVK44844.1 hypothetical protein BPNPMPFG_000309 [Mesorhizobium sp. AR07]